MCIVTTHSIFKSKRKVIGKKCLWGASHIFLIEPKMNHSQSEIGRSLCILRTVLLNLINRKTFGSCGASGLFLQKKTPSTCILTDHRSTEEVQKMIKDPHQEVPHQESPVKRFPSYRGAQEGPSSVLSTLPTSFSLWIICESSTEGLPPPPSPQRTGVMKVPEHFNLFFPVVPPITITCLLSLNALMKKLPSVSSPHPKNTHSKIVNIVYLLYSLFLYFFFWNTIFICWFTCALMVLKHSRSLASSEGAPLLTLSCKIVTGPKQPQFFDSRGEQNPLT